MSERSSARLGACFVSHFFSLFAGTGSGVVRVPSAMAGWRNGSEPDGEA